MQDASARWYPAGQEQARPGTHRGALRRAAALVRSIRHDQRRIQQLERELARRGFSPTIETGSVLFPSTEETGDTGEETTEYIVVPEARAAHAAYIHGLQNSRIRRLINRVDTGVQSPESCCEESDGSEAGAADVQGVRGVPGVRGVRGVRGVVARPARRNEGNGPVVQGVRGVRGVAWRVRRMRTKARILRMQAENTLVIILLGGDGI